MSETSHTPGMAPIDKRLLCAAAGVSYRRHCGERAIECAEADLLGEALLCLEGVAMGLDQDDETDTWGQRIFAVLAKAKG